MAIKARHQIYELKQMQSLPLSSKVTMTLRRIIEWKEYWESKGENVYVSWSGGKDSTVLKHIAQSFYPDIKLVYVDTGLEYPELKEFVRKEPNVEILHPDMPFWKVVQKYGYPVISKEVSECVENARKHINGGGYDTHYKKLFGLGEFASKSPEDTGNTQAKEFP